jgi:YcxB-like protein
MTATEDEHSMNITFVATRDPAYLGRMRRDASRDLVRFGIAYVTGLLLVSLLCFLSGDGRAVLAGLLSLTLLGLGWSAFVTPWRRAWTQWASAYLEPTTFGFTEDGMTIDAKSVSVRLSWAAVVRVVERPYAFLFMIDARNFRDVPRSGLTPAQEEELRRFLVVERALLRVPVDKRRSPAEKG